MKKIKKLLVLIYRRIFTAFSGIAFYYNDMMYFIRNSNLCSRNSTEERMRAKLIATYHIIEKGLSMPNRRMGFGREKLLLLIDLCANYYKNYGLHNQLEYAISIVAEYNELHKSMNFDLDSELQKKIDHLLSQFPDIKPARQITFTKEEYFAQVEKPFNVFSVSRHSMRHFKGSVSMETLEMVIELAKNAPSACNKQPVRVHLVSDKDKLKTILDLQQGNRGFGQNIDKLLILTTQFTGCTRYSERYMPFMDAGIFAMNLLYSLHFYKIGAIPLVWLSTPKRDIDLRNLTGIPSHEIPALVIGIGEVADNAICAVSPRLNNNNLFIHN